MNELSRMEVSEGVGELIEDVVFVNGFEKGVPESQSEVGFHEFEL